MKLKNLYLVSMALLAGALASCSDDVENFDNQLYINASVKTSTVLLKSTVPTTEGQFQLSMAKPVEHDITATLKVDASLVSVYNEAYYDNAEMLPEGHYALENEQVAIPAGTILSDVVSVKFSKLTSWIEKRCMCCRSLSLKPISVCCKVLLRCITY